MSGPTRLIEVTPELMDEWATRDIDGRRLSIAWGEPTGHDPDGDRDIYTPTITTTDDGWRLAIEREAVAAFLASPEAVEGLATALRSSPVPLATWLPNGRAAHLTDDDLAWVADHILAAIAPADPGGRM